MNLPFQVNATDADDGVNGEVHYSIPPNYSKLFEIDPFSGVIKAKTSFDREQGSQVRWFTIILFCVILYILDFITFEPFYNMQSVTLYNKS